MSEETVVVAINDTAGNIVEAEWLLRAESVHRQLRPQMPRNYAEKMQRVFADGGRMCIGTRGERVFGVAVYRVYENTCDGIQMYVDDLVTDEHSRSTGVGKALLDYMQDVARELNCALFNLDSGTPRKRAHKFYLREDMVIEAFHFTKPLK